MVRQLFFLLPVAATLGLAAAARAQAPATGFAERFALAEDRRAALAELVPGSEDFYYYSCLQRQHEGAFAAVPPLLDQWVRRHGRNERTLEIEHRQALLTFDTDPDATFAYLQRELDVDLDARRGRAGADRDLPTSIDAERYALRRFDAAAFAQDGDTLGSFRSAGLRRLAGGELSDARLRSLLGQLHRPDVPGLPALVARALSLPDAQRFGSLPVHERMTLAQLEELVRLRPQLLGDEELVSTWLRQLRPSDDPWRLDAAARLVYLERLQTFADRLPPALVALQVHVRHHRLRHDLAAGTLDRERLLAYLRLPRAGAHIAPEHARRLAGRISPVVENFPTELGAAHDDDRLVRDCLVHFFDQGDDIQPFAPYVERRYLERLHAETHLLAGRGDAARWYAMLGAQRVEELQRRVDFEFAPSQPRWFAADAPVVVEADVKNVPQMLVKVFAIDTYDFEREHGRTIDADLDLDGLVANEERALTFDEEPLRRVRRRFEFTKLTAPGTYVIEFLGGGLRSRAVIRKGRLEFVSRIGAAGHVLTVLDERGDVVRDATVWCAGREYASDADGEVAIPFAAEQRSRRIVLRSGRLTAVMPFTHHAESYRLAAGVFVPRESLVTGNRARLLVRPRLSLHDAPVPLSLLENAELVLSARDLDGNRTERTVRDLVLADDRELVHEFSVPARLQSLQVELRGEVPIVTTGERAKVHSTKQRFSVNAIDATTETACPLLGRDDRGFYLDVRGRSGEPVANVGLRVQFYTREHDVAVQELARSDSNGRVRLGTLAGLEAVSATPLANLQRSWSWQVEPSGNRATHALTGLQGQTLLVPFIARPGDTVAAASLFEARGATFLRDASAHVAMRDGFVELKGLATGNYSLRLPGEERSIDVYVTDGTERAGWAVGADRALELPKRAPLQITGVTRRGDDVEVQLANGRAGARVHVYTSRYPATYDPLARLRTTGPRNGSTREFTRPRCTYVAAQKLDDEYRYVLDRRFQPKFRGNMLSRPGLLLNPWRLERDTDFDSEQWNSAVGLGGGAGAAYGGRGASTGGPAGNTRVGEWADLDFLPEPPRLLANLRPDRDGIVRVPIAELGFGHLVHCIAIDGDDSAYRTATLPEPEMTPKDVRLQNGLDPTTHVTEQRRVEFVTAGTTVTIDDGTTIEATRYESLAQALSLLRTISGNTELDRFAWLTRWPSLAETEQLQLYSEHACHEVHFFLYQKDRAFFDRVVRPYLENKHDKTFLDRWLLGDDLTEFAEPWAFERLNVVEKILLTRRLPGLREAGARRVQELAALTEPSADQAAALFAQVLAGRALRADAPDPAKRPEADRGGPVVEFVPPPPPPPPSGTEGEPSDPAEAVVEDEIVDEELADKAREQQQERQRNKDLERRSNVRRVYRPLGPTDAYAESNYWRVPIARHDRDLVTANGYWRDYALADSERPFGSPHLAEATRNVTEMLLALAVLDLPFVAAPPAERRGDRGVELTADGAFLLARRELRATNTDADRRVLIGQSFHRIEARGDGRGPRVQEFVAGVPYECRVVLSNPTEAEVRLELLLQIPEGAVPLRGSAVTRGVPVTLAPFGTATRGYAFYLPIPGDFEHYPAHAADSGGTLLAAAEPSDIRVVAEPTSVDTTSWPVVARDGSDDDVLAFLEDNNTAKIDLDAIAWRMHDAAFFGRTLQLLRARLCYADVLWAYGLLHRDRDAVREWLAHRDRFVAACGSALRSPLLTIDPVARHRYEHVEFAPLVHARAHPLGDRPQNRNSALTAQYRELLDVLCHRPRLDAADWMSATCYLLLQDRVADGLAAFAKVDANTLPSKLQHDYFRCYLEFFGDQPTRARTIAERYRDHPIARWRQRFTDVLTQLDEAAGGDAAPTELAATEPAIDLTVADGKVTLRYQNVDSCTVSCYPLDVEFAFSSAPFDAPGGTASAYVIPDHEARVALPTDRHEHTLDLPDRFHRRDILVEATAAGITRRRTSLDNALTIQTIESRGHLQVRHKTTAAPLPRVYIKVYARLTNGNVRFHKDGYTDLRGRFDYAAVSGDGGASVERFAVLVLSETDGAEIREVGAPR